jgi:hypothetical protein
VLNWLGIKVSKSDLHIPRAATLPEIAELIIAHFQKIKDESDLEPQFIEEVISDETI